MRTKLRLLWYWLETRYAKLLRLFGDQTNGYWIKTCKYYRSTPETKGVACTYIGYMGFDPCLYDQCKICGVKDKFEKED
jgi:hypothetical protein